MSFCLIQFDNMEHNNHIVSLVFFAAILSVCYCMVDFVKASTVTEEKRLAEESYTKVQFRKTMMSTSSHRGRSIQEHGDIGQLDVCADIIGPEWMINKHGKGPCPTLDVWVPKKRGFTEFVNVNQQNKVEGGFSVAIFCHALRLLPFKIQPIFRPFINDKGESNGTYDDLLNHIAGQTCTAVAGDITIRSNRAQYIDFTIPYLSSEVYILVHAAHEWNQTLWTFVRPFTWRLWITLFAVCIFTGVAVAILEYRVSNPKFLSPFYHKLVMIIWFPISTFFFHEGKILNRCSKVVLVMWLSMVFIVVQIFTATLSSWLTLDQLRPRLPSNYDNVGYQDGSFLREFIIEKYNCSGKDLLPLKGVEEFKDALSNGSVNAVFDELPYIDLFLAKYGSDYMKFGPINQESGIAFAFPHGSPLLQNFSRAVINVTESGTMTEMKIKYLGFSTPDKPPNQPLPQSLDVQSFIGLFIFMGIVTIAAIISSEITLRSRNNRILPLTAPDDIQQITWHTNEYEQESKLQNAAPASIRRSDLLKLETQNKV